MLCFITKEKDAEFSKILKVFVHATLLTRDDDRLYFPGLCGVLQSTMGLSLQGSSTTFPHVSLFTKGMIVLRRSLYGVVSEGRVFAFSLHCLQQF